MAATDGLRIVVDLSNKSAHVIDVEGASVCSVGSGITRRNVVEALAPHGYAPLLAEPDWQLTSPPDGFWTHAREVPT